MKHLTYIVLPLLLLISCKTERKEAVQAELLEVEMATNDGVKNENFESFLIKFMGDTLFQLNRIKFPLEYVTWHDEMGEEIDTLSVNMADWKHESLYFNYATERTQIYNNFDLEIEDTNERVIHWYGIEHGMDRKYYFWRFKGEWFLIKSVHLYGYSPQN